MDFPWHKPSSYGGTHDLGNLPYMFWFWSIQKGLTNDGFCITFGIHRRPLELTFSWLVGPLVASGIEWLIYGSASCRGASVHPCPLFHQKTQIPWVLPKAPLQNYPNISISWKPFGKFRWNNWGCLKIEGNVPNFDGLSISFPMGWVAKHWGIFPKSFHPWRVRQ